MIHLTSITSNDMSTSARCKNERYRASLMKITGAARDRGASSLGMSDGVHNGWTHRLKFSRVDRKLVDSLTFTT